MMIKFLDTCSLLIAGERLFDSEESFVISSVTLNELENIKTSANKDADIKYSARLILRLLEQHLDKVKICIHDPLNEIALQNKFEISNDTKILSDAIAWNLKEPITFVTNDLSLKQIAKTFLPFVESIEEDLDDYCGCREILANDEKLAEFYQNPSANVYNLHIGEYLIIRNEAGEVVDIRCWTGTEHRYLKYKDFNSDWFGKVSPIADDPYQKCFFDSLASNQITLARGPAGSGKAQPNSTLIPTKNGYVKLGDIKVNDKILDRNGNETTVLGVFPQGLKENYKITFSDGRTAYCNSEHIWSCYTSKGNLKNFTVQDMINSGLKTGPKEWKYKIPTSAPVEYEQKNFEIDPYVMGAFLGDGCCKEKPLTISSNDEEIVQEISRLIGAYKYRRESSFNYNWVFDEKDSTIFTDNFRFQTSKFFKNYLNNVVVYAYEKSIPEEYKFGSIEQRYALLQGLMDTDGTIDNEIKGRTKFSSTSLKLVKDIQEICWSLGMSASISEDNRADKYTQNVCYSLQISCNKKDKPKLFRLKRKKDIAIGYVNNNIKSIHSNKLTIKNIEKMPHQEEMTCIYVDNPEHLYLTEQYIVTHNTHISLAYLFSLLDKHKIDKIIVFCNPVATVNSAKLGFYPGSRDEKLLDSQIGNMLGSKLGAKEAIEQLIAQEKLLLLPMSDIRGFCTSGMNAGIYITEAQNLDRTLIKLALQRIGQDCVCVIEGDDRSQVDLLAYSGSNNGMRRMSKVFRGQDFYGEVTLKKIHRSKIAEIAEVI